MNDPAHHEWHRLFSAALNDTLTEAEKTQLAALLKASVEARQLWFLYHDNECSLAEMKQPRMAASSGRTPVRSSWLQWRPLTAAAAGIVFGMLCSSVVFGYVAQRMGIQKTPLSVFNASFEEAKHLLDDGVPRQTGQWGVDAAQIVAVEAPITPFNGEHILRLEAIPREKPVKNHTSRAYQLLDLRSLLSFDGETEVEVSASFCAMNSDLSSRYLIRAIALDEAPETATKNFWSKVESDGVVSQSQRFDTPPGKSGWHTFSMKLRLPPGSKTLVLIFGAVPPEDTSPPAFVHYLDDVQVSLLTPQPLP